MPTSLDVYNKDVVNQVLAINPGRILDVGAGMGKYSDLIKQVLPRAHIDAIEASHDYAVEYKLHTKYNNVYVKDVVSFIKENANLKYDLCIMGDVMEHMFLGEALSVIDALAYRCKHLIVIWPINLPMDDEWGNVYQQHRSNFKISDLTRFNIQCYKTTFIEYMNDVPVYINLALIGGHTLHPSNTVRRANIDHSTNVMVGVINDI